jgi:anti-sigma regulatory factor (Ser/Thr protein kinase)
MGPADGWPATLERRFDGTPAVLRAVRRAVTDWLGRAGVDDDGCERAAIVVSELASNAIEAAPGRAFSVVADGSADGRVVIRVRNAAVSAAAPPPSAERHLPAATAPRGRGLAIVDALCSSVTVETTSDEIVITATVPVVR